MTTPDWQSDRGPLDPLIPGFDPFTGAGSADQIISRFSGMDRKTAKIRIFGGTVEPERTIDELVGTLESDDDMRNHDPEITKDSSSNRVKEEKRAVRISAWVYAIKYEDDQDWHMIVGTDPHGGTKTYFNCEVSGLPSKTAHAYDDLLAARQSLADILGEDSLPGPGSYTKYSPPISVTIEGSLFFDIDHAAGVVGPAGMRPETAWEIHPVTMIVANP